MDNDIRNFLKIILSIFVIVGLFMFFTIIFGTLFGGGDIMFVIVLGVGLLFAIITIVHVIREIRITEEVRRENEEEERIWARLKEEDRIREMEAVEK
jgi:fatty acid desaturase